MAFGLCDLHDPNTGPMHLGLGLAEEGANDGQDLSSRHCAHWIDVLAIAHLR